MKFLQHKEHGFKCYLSRMSPGFRDPWFNGYVVVKKGHPWYGLDSMELRNVRVHCGVTFAQHVDGDGANTWTIGFDTAHWCDEQDPKPLGFVVGELTKLCEQAREAQDSADAVKKNLDNPAN